MKYLVTGAAGFIGFHTAKKLCQQGHQVVGIDNLNDYYDVSLKLARLADLENFVTETAGTFSFVELDLVDRVGIAALFKCLIEFGLWLKQQNTFFDQ